MNKYGFKERVYDPQDHTKEIRTRTKSGLVREILCSFRFVPFRGSSGIPILIKLQRTLESHTRT